MKKMYEKNKKNQISKFIMQITSIFIVLPLLFEICIIGCKATQYHVEQTSELITEIHKTLIDEKLCRDVNDCRLKNFVLCRPENGAYFYVYGINDQRIIKKIVSLFIDQHEKNSRIHYELVMYRQTKSDTQTGKDKTIILKLVLNKEK